MIWFCNSFFKIVTGNQILSLNLSFWVLKLPRSKQLKTIMLFKIPNFVGWKSLSDVKTIIWDEKRGLAVTALASIAIYGQCPISMKFLSKIEFFKKMWRDRIFSLFFSKSASKNILSSAISYLVFFSSQPCVISGCSRGSAESVLW